MTFNMVFCLFAAETNCGEILFKEEKKIQKWMLGDISETRLQTSASTPR